MTIILCGLPMSGKTTIGKLLSTRLQLHFIDTDRLIENEYAAILGKKITCREIYRELGEAAFRAFEKHQIQQLKTCDSSVIAIGGGALHDVENIETLRSIGHLIYLRVPVPVIWKRICMREIPAYLDHTNPQRAFYMMAEQRIPIYEQASHSVVDGCDLNEDDLTERLFLFINSKTIFKNRNTHHGK